MHSPRGSIPRRRGSRANGRGAPFRKERYSHGKASVVDLAKQLIAGTNKHLASTTQVPFSGGSYTPAQIMMQFQAIVDLRAGVDAAKATTKARVASEKADGPALRSLMDAFVTYLKAAFGTQPDVLADFGIHPKARAPLTVEAKAAAAAKRKATRAARHTMGTKQKHPSQRWRPANPARSAP